MHKHGVKIESWYPSDILRALGVKKAPGRACRARRAAKRRKRT